MIRGFSWEDSALYSDDMLRRSAIFEHIYRDNLTPYHYNLVPFRRRRFYKIDYTLEGFSAQDEVQCDVRQNYLLRVRPDVLRFKRLFHQYQNEMIPQTHYTNGTLGSIFDLVFIKNIFLRIGWNRYFYNEEHYADVAELREDLYTAKNAQHMSVEAREDYMRLYNKHRPGIIAPDGEEVNFAEINRFLDEHPDMVGKEGTFDLLGFVDNFFRQREPVQVDVTPCREVVEHPNTVGIDMPAVLNERVGTPIM